jgi:hypothetical protein
VSVPVQRLVSALRRRSEVHMPLVTSERGYVDAAQRIHKVLVQHGFEIMQDDPGFWMRAPLAVLRALGRGALRQYVPQRLAYFTGPDIEVALYPSGLLLRGAEARITLAQGLAAEALTASDAFQTTDPRAQELERRIRRIGRSLEEEPPRSARRSDARLRELVRDVLRLEAPYEDWQVVYRELLQLERALDGREPLLSGAAPDPDGTRI